MNICIGGKNNIAVDCVKYLLSENLALKNDLLMIFNRKDDGRDLFQNSFRKFCAEEDLREVALEDLFEIEDLILISLEYDRIIPVEKFRSQKLYNIHFSLLPKYKGMFTSTLPILRGETHSGVTLHEIDDGIDTGDIIDQMSFEICGTDNARDLYLKYIHYGTILFKENINNLLSGNFTKTPQSPVGSTYYSKKSIDYSNVQINLRKTAFEIDNQIRAFNFQEYQIPVVYDSMIVSTEIIPNKSFLKPGTVISETDQYIDIATIDYDLRLNKLPSN